MVWHELFGLLTAGIIGVVFVSALSKSANTSQILDTSIGGYTNVLNAISAPVRGG